MQLSHMIHNNGVCVVSLSGELESDTAMVFEDYMRPLIKAHQLKAIIFNGQDLYYIDSSGMLLLFDTAKTCFVQGIPCVLCNISKGVSRILDRVLGSHMRIFSNESDALEHLYYYY